MHYYLYFDIIYTNYFYLYFLSIVAKFGQLFHLSCLNLRGSAERTCNRKSKFGPTFYVLYSYTDVNGKYEKKLFTFLFKMFYQNVPFIQPNP